MSGVILLYRHVRHLIQQQLASQALGWNVYRITSDRWGRHWQAEWNGAPRAFRAYTSWGALIRTGRAMKHWAKEQGS